MKIKTDYSDLANGQRRSARACPVALAIKRHMGDKDVVVSVDGYVLIEGHKYSLPDHARRFISLFDENIDVSPIEFELDFDENESPKPIVSEANSLVAAQKMVITGHQEEIDKLRNRSVAQDMAIADKNQTLIRQSEEIKKLEKQCNDYMELARSRYTSMVKKSDEIHRLDRALFVVTEDRNALIQQVHALNKNITRLEAETRQWSATDKESARKHQEQCSLYVERIKELEGILESKQNLVSAAGLYQGHLVELKDRLQATLLELDRIYGAHVGVADATHKLRVRVQQALNQEKPS